MRGRGQLTMDAKPRVTWVLGPSRDASQTRPQRLTTGVDHRHDALRAKLIAAAVEGVADGSHPRLGRTLHVRTAA